MAFLARRDWSNWAWHDTRRHGVHLCRVVYVYANQTPGGYELVARGANTRASGVFGIDICCMFLLSQILGGTLAGLSGAIEVTEVQHRLGASLPAPPVLFQSRDGADGGAGMPAVGAPTGPFWGWGCAHYVLHQKTSSLAQLADAITE